MSNHQTAVLLQKRRAQVERDRILLLQIPTDSSPRLHLPNRVDIIVPLVGYKIEPHQT